MALQDFAAGVSMSAKDISVELGNSTTALLDFQGAAASFSGILDTETTEGFGAGAIEAREFYGKTFSAGSGTYGTRTLHTFNYLTDDGAAQAWNSNQLIQAAENGNVGMTPDTLFSARAEQYYVDDVQDGELLNNDIVFLNSTGTGKFDGTAAAVDSGGDGSRFYYDSTANRIAEISSTGVVSNVIERKPGDLTIQEVDKDETSVTLRAIGNTQVTRTIRFYKDGSSSGTKIADGAGGTGFAGGGLDNTNVTSTDIVIGSLTPNTPYAFKCRGENSVLNGDDSNTINVTTDTTSTAFSNVFSSFSMIMEDASSTLNDFTTSGTKTLTVTNGTTTQVSCEQPSNSQYQLLARIDTNSDFSTATSFGTNVSKTHTGGTLYIQFKFDDVRDDAGDQSQESRDITITNNGATAYVSGTTKPAITIRADELF